MSLIAATDTFSCGSTAGLAAERVRARLIYLAHEIGKRNNYVGFSAFLLMALLKQRRPKF